MEDCSLGTSPQNAVDDRNDILPQQHDSEEPKQAAGAMLPDSASQDTPAIQALSGQALLSRSAAEATAASTPCADPPSLAQPANLPPAPQLLTTPEGPSDQGSQPAEPVQVCLLVMS